MAVVSIRINKKEQEDLNRAGEILGVDKRRFGFQSEVIKNSILFVIENHQMTYERFKNNFGVLEQDYIKRQMMK